MSPIQSVAALALGGIILAGCGSSTSEESQMEEPEFPDEEAATPDHMQPPERTGPPATSVAIPRPPGTSGSDELTEDSDEPTEDASPPPD
jgi:hypothetical protein